MFSFTTFLEEFPTIAPGFGVFTQITRCLITIPVNMLVVLPHSLQRAGGSKLPSSIKSGITIANVVEIIELYSFDVSN